MARQTVPISLAWLVIALVSCASPHDHHQQQQSAVEQSAPPPPLLRFGYGPTHSGSFNGGVRAILHDSRGHYWFGSWGEGAARWDGETMICFTVADGLADKQVRSIHEDGEGVIWFECAQGISTYANGVMMQHTLRDHISIVDSQMITPDDLWFKNDAGHGSVEHENGPGAYRLNNGVLSFVPFPLPNESGYSVTGISVGRSDANNRMVWFATYNAVVGYDGESFTILDSEALGLNESTGYLHTRCVLEDSAGRLWIGNNGIGVILVEGEMITNFTQEHGVGRRDRRTGAMNMNPQPGDAPEGEPTMHRVFSVGEDAAGNIWFGTAEQGAWRYDGHALRQFTEADGLDSPGINAIHTDRDGTLLLGGDGVYRFDGERFMRVF